MRYTYLLVAFVALLSTASAQPIQQLFNGKNLKGWKQLGGKAIFRVQDGEIQGLTVANTPNSFLVTEQEYGDFIFEAMVKLDSPVNSGIQFRSSRKADYLDGKVFGYQMEIDPSTRNWSGGIYDESRRGWLYPMDLNPLHQIRFKPGQWYRYRIECIGNDLRTFIDGRQMAHVVDDASNRGFIALQVHAVGSEQEAGKIIHWKSITLQTSNLHPSRIDTALRVVNYLPNQLSAAEKQQGYRLLWDGATTKGWRGAYKDSFPAKGWQISNGELQVLSSAGAESTNGGDIVSTEKFGAFVLQFDFKLSEGANSGVKYFVTEAEHNSGSAIGLEYQLLDDERHPDAKMGSIGNRTLASLYDLIPSIKHPNASRKIGEWNKGMLVVYPDNRIEHWLNGVKVVEYQRGTSYFYALVARSKYEKWPNFGMAPAGHILLQDHGDQVSFRSIKIKPL